MCIIFYIILVNAFRAIYCEWIQIAQSSHSADKVNIDQSFMRSNEKLSNFDYSKYKGFFSVIEPDIDFEIPHKNVVIKADYHNSDRNTFKTYANSSTIFDKPFDRPSKNEVSMSLLNVSVFSGSSDLKRDKIVISPSSSLKEIKLQSKSNETKSDINRKSEIKTESPRKLTEAGEDRKNGNQTKILLKRIEFKRFNFNDVFKFFANIQQSFSFDASAGIQSKISFLESFKNSLLNSIGEWNGICF